MDFSLAPLEFQRLKDLLGRYVSTQAGRALLEDLHPHTNTETLEDEQTITAEGMSYLREHRVPFPDIALLFEALEKLSVSGALLEIPEIEAVQSFLGQVEGLRIRWKDEREKFPRLAQAAHRLPDLRELAKHLGRAIQNGEVDERYSPELRRIRRALEVTRSRLTDKLESLVRNPSYSSQLQDQLITIRNGRFVIPVRAEQKRGFDGIVHGSSSSGATVFMEPLAVLEMNNELVRLGEAERAEIVRILAELTDLIQKSIGPLEHAQAVSAYLEIVFAKARFGRDFDCIRPVFSSGGLLSLIKARHPLLEDNLRSQGQPISPVSLDIDSNRRILVISGPNAGGKTVVLKTVGLLALMAQCGIPVPAEDATLPVFEHIIADIGDQQSIMNHLSTFSAHVLAIKSMLESVNSKSLILLDEIGSSTEPGEGAALARAVLEEFRKIGALTIATTHYNRLKLYAETTPGVANSAMEFNEMTLQPTYRLLHGLAGASSGLKIAERLQLPASVLHAAIGFLDMADAEAAHYVEELRRRVVDLEAEKARLENERREFDEWKRKEFDQLTTQHKEEIARVEKKVEQIAREMSDRASKELESVRDDSVKRYQRKLANVKAQATSEIRREQQKITPAETKAAETAPRSTAVPVAGSTVRVSSMGVTGSVLSIRDDEVEVMVGNIKLRRPVSDVELIERKAMKLPEGVRVSFSSKQLEKNEINLIGCNVDEALDRTDKFLDDAFLAEMSEVRLVHGSGTGALRHAISEFLSNHPHVARFEAARQNDGGRGVTLVTLRS